MDRRKNSYKGEWHPRRRRSDWQHDYVILAEPVNDRYDELEDDEEGDRRPS
jgi:hypothetical protein